MNKSPISMTKTSTDGYNMTKALKSKPKTSVKVKLNYDDHLYFYNSIIDSILCLISDIIRNGDFTYLN